MRNLGHLGSSNSVPFHPVGNQAATKRRRRNALGARSSLKSHGLAVLARVRARRVGLALAHDDLAGAEELGVAGDANALARAAWVLADRPGVSVVLNPYGEPGRGIRTLCPSFTTPFTGRCEKGGK